MIYDIIVIGGGPAGLTSAIYGSRGGASVLVLEKAVCGGQIINSPEVENYPGRPKVAGVDLMMDMMEQAISFGTEIIYDEAISISRSDKVLTVSCTSSSYEGKSIIIATGRKNRSLGIENEDKFIGNGISYCATCDGGFYKGKNTAVVGGGNTALHDALYLSELCDTVTLIHRRNEFRGETHTLERVLKKPNIKIITPAKITKLLGDERLEGVEIEKDGEQDIIKVDGLFVAVGQIPQPLLSSNLSGTEDGYILSDESTLTDISGVFSAGDCRKKDVYQLTTAVSDGAVSGTAALSYISYD